MREAWRIDRGTKGVVGILAKESVKKESEIKEVMEEVVLGKNVKEAVKREKIENLEEEVLKLVKEKPGLSVNAYMWLIMKKFKGKVSGKEVVEILKKLVK